MTSGTLNRTTDDVAKVRAKFIDANKRRFGLRGGGVVLSRAARRTSPPKLRDRVRGWDLEFESGLLQQPVCLSSEP